MHLLKLISSKSLPTLHKKTLFGSLNLRYEGKYSCIIMFLRQKSNISCVDRLFKNGTWMIFKSLSFTNYYQLVKVVQFSLLLLCWLPRLSHTPHCRLEWEAYTLLSHSRAIGRAPALISPWLPTGQDSMELLLPF